MFLTALFHQSPDLLTNQSSAYTYLCLWIKLPDCLCLPHMTLQHSQPALMSPECPRQPAFGSQPVLVSCLPLSTGFRILTSARVSYHPQSTCLCPRILLCAIPGNVTCLKCPPCLTCSSNLTTSCLFPGCSTHGLTINLDQYQKQAARESVSR